MSFIYESPSRSNGVRIPQFRLSTRFIRDIEVVGAVREAARIGDRATDTAMMWRTVAGASSNGPGRELSR